jgi:hypothetical protein
MGDDVLVLEAMTVEVELGNIVRVATCAVDDGRTMVLSGITVGVTVAVF